MKNKIFCVPLMYTNIAKLEKCKSENIPRKIYLTSTTEYDNAMSRYQHDRSASYTTCHCILIFFLQNKKKFKFEWDMANLNVFDFFDTITNSIFHQKHAILLVFSQKNMISPVIYQQIKSGVLLGWRYHFITLFR